MSTAPEQRLDPPGAGLSPAKAALLQARLQGRNRAVPAVRLAHGHDVPLSFAQERLWFLHRLQPHGSLYNVTKALRLRGPVDEAVLERALGEIVRRHDGLRTVFREVDGAAMQRALPFQGFTLQVEDLSHLPEAEREAQAGRVYAREAAHPYDLSAGPLFRVTLVRVGPEERVVVFGMHHIVSDGWSMSVLFREMWVLYDAFREGRESPLAELPMQYADFAVWQREQLRGPSEARHLAYWREQLAGVPELLELPTDHPRPPASSSRGATVPVYAPPEVLEGLRALARGEGATVFMVILAAFQLLLARYADTDDVVVGTPVAGRTRREVEGMIGFFVNTLVLRTRLSGDWTFRELAGRVRETVLGALDHQDMPFERLVDDLRPERSLSHSALFQVMFQLENEELRAGQPEAGREVRVQPADQAQGTAKFDLSLDLDARARGIVGVLEYSTDLFREETARRLVRHLVAVLEQAAADPDFRIHGLELLAGEERRTVLEEWGRATVAGPPHRWVHQRFEDQARRTPDAAAVVEDGRTITYRELDERASRLAGCLRRAGVRREVRVAICLPRSAHLPVCMLAVLKAGGAYVPLDPDYPEERLAWMLGDAGAAVLLTTDGVAGRLPPHGAVTVRVDADRERIEAEAPLPADGEFFPEQLAYVIYTSGSTGTPKGAGIPHLALTTHMDWMERAYPLAPGDRVLQKTSASFDGSVWEFWAPLTAGAALVVAPPDAHRDAAELVRVVAREGITVLQVVPILLGALLELEELGRCATLRRLCCGGEPLPTELAARAHALLGAQVVNLYGPTEATMNAAVHTWSAADTGVSVPIGRPLDTVHARVLDRFGVPVPPGVPGELLVGGAHLARGYLDRPGLTAERFVPDPFSHEPGARLYRTGDRVRWLDGGVLDYLGRMDHQVKVRGFRIEPGEVEEALRRHATVRECVVVVREDRPGDRRLVGYVVPRPGGADPAVLREHLQRSLPGYMVPDAVVLLDAFPQSPTGKLDRAALPPPADLAAGARNDEPADFVEVQLIDLWEELLGVRGISPTDSFFQLGGNSLLALRLFARVRQRMGRDLPVSMLFAGATVRDMARAVGQPAAAEGLPPSVVPLRPVGPLPPLFCIHSADRRVFGYVQIVRHLGAEQPAFGLQDLGDDLARPLARIAAEHVEALRAVQPEGPYYLLGASFGGFVAYEMARQLEQAGCEVAFVGLMDTMAPTMARAWAPPDDLELVLGMAHDVAEHMGCPFALDREALAGLSFDAQLRRAVEALHAQGAAPPGYDAAALGELCQLIRDRTRSASGYAAGPLSTPITLFRASTATEYYDRFLDAYAGEEQRTLGWCGVSPLPVEVVRVPGTHNTMGAEPHVRVFVTALREALAAARQRAGSPTAPAAPQS